MSKCAICEKELPARKKGAGRPMKFCNEACRRASEYELRRVQDRLSRLENEAECARRNPLLASLEKGGQIDAEIKRNRDRLLVLLD